MNNKYLVKQVICETQKSLHEVGLFVKKMNNIYPSRYSKAYEELIGLKHIVVTINGEVYDIEKGMLKTSQTQDGYLTVNINRKPYLVHRLVALAFCINHDKKNKVVCHKNKVRTDNRACNLMWTNNHYIANRREDGYYKKKENINRPIKVTNEDGYKKVFPNANRAMEELGVQRGNIYKVCKGERLTAGGYKFSYATIEDLLED